MAVLRASRDPSLATAVVLDLGDLRRQADAIRESAVAEAARILEAARAERERLVATARAEGFAAGQAEGRAAGLEQGRAEGRAEALAAHRAALDALAAKWEGVLAQFLADREHLMTQARSDLVRLAVALGRRVTRRTIAHDPGVVAAQVETVLAAAAKPTRLTVRVHPEDEALAREALPTLLARFTGVEGADLVTDASLERGSCVANTRGGGEIDASIPTQLDRIAAALLPGEGAA